MSGTPEFYLNNRWKGLEKLSEFIGDKKCSKNNSVDLSTSENIAEVVKWTPKTGQQFKWDTVTRNGVNHDRDQKAQRSPAGVQSQGGA